MATIAVLNPATGARIGEVPEHDAEAVSLLADRARAAQPRWAATAVENRCAVLARAAKLLLRDAERVVRTVVEETGKPWEDAQFAEVGATVQALRFWAKRAPGWLADERWRSASPVVLGRTLVVRHAPIGLVGVIAPWNYPLANGINDLMPALAAGNAVLLKPSEHTPLSGLLGADLLREAGLPDGVLQVATGGPATGEAVIDHTDMVMFTGSSRTGRAVAERAGRNLIPCSLELGGKDPMIVCADAELDRAANTAVYYALQNSGQVCMSIERVYVEQPVYGAFVDRVVERVRALRQGEPSRGPGTVELGAMTFPPQLDLVEAHVADAIARGAQALTGGRRRGSFYEPTVLVGVDHSMRCMQEETFGPTLPIVAVADEDEAVRLANDSRYGLGASVFSRDVHRAERIARRLRVGSVAVNDAMVFYGAMDLPMGGWGESGLGTRHGRGGLLKYTRPQSLVLAGRLPRRDPHFYPYRRRFTTAVLRAMQLAGGRRRT